MVLDPGALALDGRVALVTGAASGIGQAIALGLARFGAVLALCDRDAEALDRTRRLLEDQGSAVSAEALDVRNQEAVARFVEQVTQHHRRIDILVNNAGGTFRADFEEVSEGGQRAIVDLNFNAVTHLVRCVLPHMPAPRSEENAGPSIVNITSIEAHRAAPGYAIYAAMKAALENLTRSLALELGARGIRINCVAPDLIPTMGTGPMEIQSPLARTGHVDDVAGAVFFLVSPLSNFVTGTTIHVDGGGMAAGGWRRNEDGGFDLA